MREDLKSISEIREAFYKLGDDARGEILADLLEIAVNSMTFDGETFIATFKGFHRTLQQNALGLFFKTIHSAATWHTDLRNEAAIERCKTIEKAMEVYTPMWHKMPFI